MPNDQQLRYNTVLIQPEGSIADGGDDTNVLSARLVSANIIRDVAGAQERIDPWRTREFTEVKHQGWSVQLFGELRAGGFLPWIVQAIATAGTAERGLSVYELLPANTDPATFAMQFQGIEGTSTFLGLKAKRINLTMVAGGVITYALEFAGLQRIDTEGDWTSTGTEAGERSWLWRATSQPTPTATPSPATTQPSRSAATSWRPQTSPQTASRRGTPPQERGTLPAKS